MTKKVRCWQHVFDNKKILASLWPKTLPFIPSFSWSPSEKMFISRQAVIPRLQKTVELRSPIICCFQPVQTQACMYGQWDLQKLIGRVKNQNWEGQKKLRKNSRLTKCGYRGHSHARIRPALHGKSVFWPNFGIFGPPVGSNFVAIECLSPKSLLETLSQNCKMN